MVKYNHLVANLLIFRTVVGMTRALDRLADHKCMGAAERRGLTPLAWGHVNPYGAFHLDMSTRLPLDMPGLHADSSQLPFLSV